MPSGVFKPYAGVSTAVLVFTKTNAGGTDKVWFYDMKADGFSLDDKRNPIEKNDIPDVIERLRGVTMEDFDDSFIIEAEKEVDKIRDAALQIVQKTHPEIKFVLDRRTIDDYSCKTWDYRGKWYYKGFKLPDGFYSKEELIEFFNNLPENDDPYKSARKDVREKFCGDYKDQNCKSYADVYFSDK